MISDIQLVRRLSDDNTSLQRQVLRLKRDKKKLIDELNKIKGIIIRLQAEVEC